LIRLSIDLEESDIEKIDADAKKNMRNRKNHIEFLIKSRLA
jgi:hypothetical protein